MFTRHYLIDIFSSADKVTRGAAIITVKRWVPDSPPMDGMIREFALQMLRKLQSRPKTPEPKSSPDVSMSGVEGEAKEGEDGENGEAQDEHMEDGQLPSEDLVQTPYLPERIELPAQKSHVLQHVELLFALSVKVPEFLDEYEHFSCLPVRLDGLTNFVGIEYFQLMAKWTSQFNRLYSSSSLRLSNHWDQAMANF